MKEKEDNKKPETPAPKPKPKPEPSGPRLIKETEDRPKEKK